MELLAMSVNQMEVNLAKIKLFSYSLQNKQITNTRKKLKTKGNYKDSTDSGQKNVNTNI